MTDFEEEELEDSEHPLAPKEEGDELFLGLGDDDDGVLVDEELSEEDEAESAGMRIKDDQGEVEPDF